MSRMDRQTGVVAYTAAVPARPGMLRPMSVGSILVTLVLTACAQGPAATPPVSPGTPVRPREVNIVARDDVFSPPTVDLVPGETVVIHLVNGGLGAHEAIIGDQQVQDAWEVAEANQPPARPGVTPAVSVPPAMTGVRIVVRSGERVDVTWTVPTDPDRKSVV